MASKANKAELLAYRDMQFVITPAFFTRLVYQGV